MGIYFNKSQVETSALTHEETERIREEKAARGYAPQVLPRAGFIHRKHDEFEELKGSYIEINQRACTDEEYQKLCRGEELDRDSYGKKWRVWTGGFPTTEQMAAAPWEA